jgi:hypothetical protein
MQGRPDRGNESWKRDTSDTDKLAALLASKRRATLQGTGKHRAISTSTGEYRVPQRPPDMRHLDSRPDTPRVPRPQRRLAPSRRKRPFLIVMGSIVAIMVIIVFAIGILLVSAVNQSAGPTKTAVNFLSSITSPGQDYEAAFDDLGPAITIRINREAFITRAKGLDKQHGAIIDFREVANSALVKDNTRSFAYTITRDKPDSKPYKLTLILQEAPADSNNWKIVDYGINCHETGCYGTTLGPTPS